MKIALNKNIPGKKKIEMLGHRSGERVLDRNYRDWYFAGFELVEDLNRTRARNDCATLYHAPGGFVAERSWFSLDGNFHSENLAGRFYRKQILLEQKGVHSIGIIMGNDFDDIVTMAFVKENCGGIVDGGLETNRLAFRGTQSAFGGIE